MTIENIQAVYGRIAEIQQRMGALTPATQSTSGAFDAVFRDALQSSTAAGTRAVGGSGPSRPPAGLEGLENGRVPAAALTTIAPGQALWGPAANAYGQMAAAARAAGINLQVTDSYRSYDAQVDVARRKGLYSQGGLAATPGTSTHGWGLSVDVDIRPESLEWLRRNANRYGFVEDVGREPWHWTYRGAAAPPAGASLDPIGLRLLR